MARSSSPIGDPPGGAVRHPAADGFPRWLDRRAIREIAWREDRYRILEYERVMVGSRRVGRLLVTAHLDEPPVWTLPAEHWTRVGDTIVRSLVTAPQASCVYCAWPLTGPLALRRGRSLRPVTAHSAAGDYALCGACRAAGWRLIPTTRPGVLIAGPRATWHFHRGRMAPALGTLDAR